MTFGMYAMLFLMPLYLQIARGAPAAIVGLDMLPMSLAFLLVSQKSGALAGRFGARAVMTAGMAAMALGLFMLASIAAGTDLWFIALAFLIIGVGLGLNTGPALSVAVAATPKTYSGTAASVINTARMIGATAGVALLGGLFAAHVAADPSQAKAVIAGLHPALLGGAATEGLGAIVAFAAIPADALARTGDGRLSASSE
jgi:MFS family permease